MRALDAIEERVELNRQMNETLEATARALFKSWFIDFDPVRAKAEGRDPGLPPHLADLFPDSFVDSELGEIPAGWQVRTIGDLAEQRRDSVAAYAIQSGTPYIGLEHMPRGSVALGDWETADSVISGKVRFSRGDILFGKLRPYFKKVGVAPVDGVASSDIVVVQPTNPENFGLLLMVLASQEFIDYTDAVSGGTRMPRVSWTDMVRYPLAYSPFQANALSEIVRPIVERIRANVHGSRTLAAVRDALLPKLISGDLRVEDSDRFLEGAREC